METAMNSTCDSVTQRLFDNNESYITPTPSNKTCVTLFSPTQRNDVTPVTTPTRRSVVTIHSRPQQGHSNLATALQTLQADVNQLKEEFLLLKKENTSLLSNLTLAENAISSLSVKNDALTKELNHLSASKRVPSAPSNNINIDQIIPPIHLSKSSVQVHKTKTSSVTSSTIINKKRPSSPQKALLLIGDSHIRHLDCKRIAKSSAVKKIICQGKLAHQFHQDIDFFTSHPHENNFKNVIIHVGSNDAFPQSAEPSSCDIKQLLLKTKSAFPISSIHFSSILPKSTNSALLSTIFQMNNAVKTFCLNNNINFIDHSSTFSSFTSGTLTLKDNLFLRDLIYTNDHGTKLFARNLIRALHAPPANADLPPVTNLNPRSTNHPQATNNPATKQSCNLEDQTADIAEKPTSGSKSPSYSAIASITSQQDRQRSVQDMPKTTMLPLMPPNANKNNNGLQQHMCHPFCFPPPMIPFNNYYSMPPFRPPPWNGSNIAMPRFQSLPPDNINPWHNNNYSSFNRPFIPTF